MSVIPDVRAELYSLNCPYRFSDSEIQAQIDAEEAGWAAHKVRVRETLGPHYKYSDEPIPRHWIVQGAARRLWDDLRLPFVFMRAEAYERIRATRATPTEAKP